MIVISAQQVRTLLTIEQSIVLMEHAMKTTSAGAARLPQRWGLALPSGGLMGMMPGYLPDPECFGIKVVNIMPQNQNSSFSSHLGAVLLFDSKHGLPLAIIDAAQITALRTSAASALATRLLAKESARILTIVGTGEQARAHIDALVGVRDFKEIRVCSGQEQRAEQFAASYFHDTQIKLKPFNDIASAVAGADVICTVTNASSPILFESMLEPGMHINLVGASTPDKQEVDTRIVFSSRYFVDYAPAATAQAAELIAALQAVTSSPLDEEKSVVTTEIGKVISGDALGRQYPDDITVYRSLGVATQDLTVAWYLYEQAQKQQLGTHVDF
jgi:ornithine cyclodeaminase/alanine dehydrogenase-like protein (mu-crystallin family)